MLEGLWHKWNDWAPLPLRLGMGAGFIIHGYPKLFTDQGHAGLASTIEGAGLPLPELMAWMSGGVEFFGGILLIIGAFVPIVAALGIVNMLAAMFIVHWGHGFAFTSNPPGIEVNVLYIAGFLALILGGAGAMSFDGWLSATADGHHPGGDHRRSPR